MSVRNFISCILLFTFCAVHAQDSASVNKNMVAFCEKNVGKKVGNGECWDLAKEALNSAGAAWTPPYEYGNVVLPTKAVLPGDVIQFEKVKIVYPDKSWKELPHHTAIVYKVLGPGKYIIAEQNSNNKKLVVLNEIDLNYVKKGKFTVYRPR
jgi:hypothetical protein